MVLGEKHGTNYLPYTKINAWNDPEIGIEWPELVGDYNGTALAEGYTLKDGTKLNLSGKDQKGGGVKNTFKF